MTDKDKPPVMFLKTHFDVNQVGSVLQWHYIRKDHEGNPIEGKDAGSVYFTKGETLFVEVSGGGKPLAGGASPFTSFTILDCCMMTEPQLADYGPGRKTLYSPPSPFVTDAGAQPYYATIGLAVDKFKPLIGAPKPPDYFQQTQIWDDHLTVGQVEGRWKMSFMITVEIAGPDGVTQRVFGFDPEGTVGSGMNPP